MPRISADQTSCFCTPSFRNLVLSGRRTARGLPAALTILVAGAVGALAAHAQLGGEGAPAAEPAEFAAPALDRSLVLEPLGKYGRSAEFSDPVLAALARDPAWTPSDGAAMSSADGRSATWRPTVLGADGSLEGGARSNSWWFQRWVHERDEVLLFEAPGAGVIYAGSEPRMGDLYSLGIVRAPIAMRKGSNELLVRIGRGQPRVSWSRPPAPIYVEKFDRTLPDIVTGPGVLGGKQATLPAAVLVTNATTRWARGLTLSARAAGVEGRAYELPALAPLETRKVSFGLPSLDESRAESVSVELALRTADGAVLHRDAFDIAVRRSTQHHARTFVSRIDQSVQYFAVAPPARAAQSTDTFALILSLHGASVEARGQAAAYSQKDWCYVVAPTNRRPYGFDWEDWGRRDALEVLDYALGLERLADVPSVEFDSQRVYLTGHSMGGHGTWQIGARFADRFAAIAPSAGWSDFWSYMGADANPPSDPIGAVLHRASNGSRTLLWAPNYAKHGVYVLHGDADDNVPVREARRMREELAKFHRDFAYFEQPGAGHWWGNECVDWPQLMEFLRLRALPDRDAATEVSIRLVDLDSSRSSGFASVLAQTHPLEVSELSARAVPGERRFEVQTTNVEALRLSDGLWRHPGVHRRWSEWPEDQSGRATVDGVELELPAALRNGVGDGWTLRRNRGTWRLEPADCPAERHKQPGASGPFKEAFDNAFVLVYGTAGDPAENVWSLAKARFDADQFRYRGNASPLTVSDSELLAALDSRGTTSLRGRNLVLYGNAKSNSAWSKVVDSAALDVQPGRLRIGSHTFEGADLSVLAVRPHARSPGSLVALVGGTGVVGMRALNHAPYFVSGAGFPDWWVARAAFLSDGLSGHLAAGFFRSDWSVDDASDTVVRAPNAARSEER